MGVIDNLRGVFSNSKNTQVHINDEYEKSRLAEKIVDLVNTIKGINSFDISVRNLSNVSSYELTRESLDELKRLYSNLENRLSELNRQRERGNQKRESLEAARWTGKKPEGWTDRDFDRFQRSDDGR